MTTEREEMMETARERIEAASIDEIERVFHGIVGKSRAAAMQHVREMAGAHGFTAKIGSDRVAAIIDRHFGARPH